MSGRAFVDTSVFVYVFDSAAAAKQRAASGLLERLSGEASIVVSTQVLQEFCVSVTRKLARPLPGEKAAEATRRLADYQVVQLDTPMILSAIALCRKESASSSGRSATTFVRPISSLSAATASASTSS